MKSFNSLLLCGQILQASLFCAWGTGQAGDANRIVLARAHQMDGSHVPVGGSVQAHKSVVLAAQMPGRVVTISGEEGDAFAEGALLVALDETELRAQRRGVEAQWASAAATARNAGVQFDRQLLSPATSYQTPGGMALPGMFDQMFTNPMSSMMGTRSPGVERHADIYGRSVAIEQAQHSLEQAAAQLRKIDSKIRDARSIAPFSGVITSKLVEKGDTVQPGQPLIEFEDLSKLQLVADIPVRLGNALKEGDQLAARVDIRAGQIKVRLATIYPTADPVRHTIRMKFDLPEDIKVPAGTYAEVWIPSSASSGGAQTLVPASAVVQRGGLPVVFVVGDDNRTQLRMVRLGGKVGDSEVVVLYGVKAGERLLDRPSANITSDAAIDGG